MTNGDDARRYQDPQTAAMGERISNLNRRQTDFEAESRANFRGLEASIGAITAEMRQSFTSIKDSLAERSKPQWQAYGVMVTVVVVLGGLVYWPIREATSDLKTAVIDTNKSIQALAERTVSRQEMDWRAARGQEDRIRTDTAISDLREGTVTRAEWLERNRARDQEVTDLGRRVDELRQDVGSVYGTRDVIQDLKKEIDNLRQRFNSRGLPPPA